MTDKDLCVVADKVRSSMENPSKVRSQPRIKHSHLFCVGCPIIIGCAACEAGHRGQVTVDAPNGR
jgi:hypothetical protein